MKSSTLSSITLWTVMVELIAQVWYAVVIFLMFNTILLELWVMREIVTMMASSYPQMFQESEGETSNENSLWL